MINDNIRSMLKTNLNNQPNLNYNTMKNQKIMRILFFIYLISTHLLYGQCKLNYSNYTLVFNEEFRYSTTSQLATNWQFDLSPWPCANTIIGNCHESQYYAPSQVSLLPNSPSGILRISAQRLVTPLTVSCAANEYDTSNCPYTGDARLAYSYSGSI